MAYTSIFKDNQDSQPSTSTGYKSIFKTETPTPVKSGSIVNKTLSSFLGGGTYAMEKGNPNTNIKGGHTTYGGVGTQQGYERADIFPQSLSGVNASSSNITMEKNLPEFDSGANKQYRTATDKYLMTDVLPKLNSGKISLREAQVNATSFLRNQKEGLDSSNINAGGKLGEVADSVVNFFKGIGKTQPNEPTPISTKQLAQNLSQKLGNDVLKASNSTYKTAEFNKEGMVPSKLQLPETNWAFKAINTLYNVPAQAQANVVTNLTKLSSANTPLKRVTGGIQTATSALNLIPEWLAFSTTLKAAEEVPVVGNVAKAVNYGFGKLVELGAYGGGKAVDIAPLSDETKKEIRPAVEELGALAAQLVGGKKALDIVGKFSDTIKSKVADKQAQGVDVTPEVAKEIINETKQNIDTTYTNKTKQDLVEKPTQENLQKVVETTKELPPIEPINKTPLESIVKPQEAQGEVLPTEMINNTNETFTPRLAESNKQKAIDLGVKPEEFNNLPQVEKINLEQQFNKAKDYISADAEKARSILRGEEMLPGDVNATQFLAAAEKYLKENPNKDMAYEIANSNLTKAASLAGQEVVSAKLREPDSFTAKIIDLKRAREESKIKDIEGKKSIARKSLKDEIKKVNLPKEDLMWDKFLSSIEC